MRMIRRHIYYIMLHGILQDGFGNLCEIYNDRKPAPRVRDGLGMILRLGDGQINGVLIADVLGLADTGEDLQNQDHAPVPALVFQRVHHRKVKSLGGHAALGIVQDHLEQRKVILSR